MAPSAVNHKSINLWTARVLPVLIIGIVGYVTYVVVVLVCGMGSRVLKYTCTDSATIVDLLIDPSDPLRTPRHGAAVAVLVLYFVTLFLASLSYFRLLWTVFTNPGYVPRGPQWYARHQSPVKRKRRSTQHQSNAYADPTSSVDPRIDDNPIDHVNSGHVASSSPTGDEPAPGLQRFFGRDVFVCQGDGRPIWCSSCLNWKPDRAHHCREVDRCVRKMDHFCPWVGGVVSETSFKFFIQFVTWTAIYCLFNLILMAILVAKDRRDSGGAVNINWIVTLALASLFGLMTFGMAGSSLQFAFLNTTTIENLSRKTIVWQLAVHLRNPSQTTTFPTISYSTAQKSSNALLLEHDSSPNTIKTFAILHSKPGDNPWDLGYLKNLQTVLGEHWYDWLLPIKYSRR